MITQLWLVWPRCSIQNAALRWRMWRFGSVAKRSSSGILDNIPNFLQRATPLPSQKFGNCHEALIE
jgi:hypothetical protein